MLFGGFLDVERAGATLALDKGQDSVLVVRPSAPNLNAFLASDKSLIDLDNLSAPAHWAKLAIAHCFANAVPKKPSGLHAARKHALDLVGRDALLTSAHKVDNLKPEMQRQVRGLENRPHAHGKRLSAFLAVVKTLASSISDRLRNTLAIAIAAMRANRAVRPKQRFDVRKGGVFVLEAVLGKNGMSHGAISYGLIPTMDAVLCQV
jgi:hypothetical protein